MIRSARRTDKASLLDVAVDSGLFDEELAKGLGAEIDRHFDTDANGPGWFVDEEGAIRAAAYVEPELFADGTWNLQFLAVGRGHQGMGLGRLLVEHVEQVLQSLGGRVLIVETSSVESFEATRDFYLKTGFVEEARIRDFYAPGDAKVVFWKAIG